jgi:hypothetical protein
MNAFFKTLFGSPRTIAVGVVAVGLAAIVLRSPVPVLAGFILPAALLAGAGYLARH